MPDLNTHVLRLSFPCLRAVALQRAGVETGIQALSLRRQGTIILKTWIPRIKCGAGLAFAGMTNSGKFSTV